MKPIIIKGSSHTDHRGTVHFINDFDMSGVKRFYSISHPNVQTRRGWRGHRIEQRWFCVVDGAFEIDLVSIDNWDMPSTELPVSSFLLKAGDDEVLHVPVGYASCLRATVENSKIMIFADYGIDNSTLDDYLWPIDYFKNKQ